MGFLCFSGGRAWVGVGVHARKVVPKEAKILYQKSRIAEVDNTLATFINPFPGFIHLTQVLRGIKEETLPRSFNEVCITLIATPKNDKARKEHERPI